MSVDKTGLRSSGYAGALPQRSVVSPDSDNLLDQGVLTGLASAGGRAASSSYQFLTSPITQKWVRDTEAWSTRTALGEMCDRLTKTNGSATSASAGAVSGQAAGQGASTASASSAGSAATAAGVSAIGSHSYSKLLHLGEHQMKGFSWKSLTETASKNFRGFFSRLNEARHGGRSFFEVRGQKVTPQSFVKNTVVGENIKPIQAMANKQIPLAERRIGTGMARVFGFGLVAYGILDETKKAYREAKAQEDGTLKSRCKTWLTTGKTLVGRTLKSAMTWEIAGLGFHLGKNLLPFVLGGIPLGGIVVGALVGSVVFNGLNKLIPTGPKNKSTDANPALPGASTAPMPAMPGLSMTLPSLPGGSAANGPKLSAQA